MEKRIYSKWKSAKSYFDKHGRKWLVFNRDYKLVTNKHN